MEKRPKKKTFDDAWSWNSICDFIRKKHGRDLRNFAGKKYTGKKDDPEYQNLWHFIVDGADIHNGCFFYMPEIDDSNPSWVNEALRLIFSEFPDAQTEPVWVSW